MGLIYLVGYTVKEDKTHGIEAHESIIAGFATYAHAEEFVKKCLPAENRNRFFIQNEKLQRVIFEPVKTESEDKDND